MADWSAARTPGAPAGPNRQASFKSKMDAIEGVLNELRVMMTECVTKGPGFAVYQIEQEPTGGTVRRTDSFKYTIKEGESSGRR
jgi:hypothetical protein